MPRFGGGGKMGAERDRERIVIAVSACLLGEAVRYDGGHKRDGWIAGVLARHLDVVPFCPEVGAGLGVPRGPVQLVAAAGGVRVRGVGDPERDVTGAIEAFARRTVEELVEVAGCILKARSPSCGLEAVPVHDAAGAATGRGRGAFARVLLAARPLLPCVEEGALADAAGRLHFIERVTVYARWRRLLRAGPSAAALRRFHARHETLLRARAGADPLARLAARGDTEAYGRGLMETLAQPATDDAHVARVRRLLGPLAAALGDGAR